MYEQRWRWQRWAAVGAAFAAGAGVVAVAILASWNLSAAVTQQVANVRTLQWESA
jgi:glucose/arabinose dehydrogenase